LRLLCSRPRQTQPRSRRTRLRHPVRHMQGWLCHHSCACVRACVRVSSSLGLFPSLSPFVRPPPLPLSLPLPLALPLSLLLSRSPSLSLRLSLVSWSHTPLQPCTLGSRRSTTPMPCLLARLYRDASVRHCDGTVLAGTASPPRTHPSEHARHPHSRAQCAAHVPFLHASVAAHAGYFGRVLHGALAGTREHSRVLHGSGRR
jgi:hypothetical protein